jgi:hypothetical protein
MLGLQFVHLLSNLARGLVGERLKVMDEMGLIAIAPGNLAECSTSFRNGLRRWPLLPILGVLVAAACINKMDRVTAKRECFGGSFQMLADIQS